MAPPLASRTCPRSVPPTDCAGIDLAASKLTITAADRDRLTRWVLAFPIVARLLCHLFGIRGVTNAAAIRLQPKMGEKIGVKMGGHCVRCACCLFEGFAL